MNLQKAAITGVHGYAPDYVLTNKELETMVDTNDEWITTRTGIKERRILKEKGKAASDMCVEVVNGILEKTGTKPEEIDMLICATITGDRVLPDTANTICDKVGAVNAFGYDINAACSGFLYAMVTGAKFIETHMYKKVLVLGVDVMSSIIDYTDRATCIIFGDGAGGVLLEPAQYGKGIVDAVLGGDGAGREYLNMKAGGSLRPPTAETVAAREHYVYQEGRQVFKMAIKGMTGSVEELLQRNQLTIDDIDWVVPHQANIRIIDSVREHLGVPDHKVMKIIEYFGNTTAGTLPMCLWQYEDKLKKGDKLVFTAFGGGFTWGSVLVEWEY